MRRSRRIGAVPAAAAVAAIVIGCSLAPTSGPEGGPSGSAAPAGGTLRVGIVGLGDAEEFAVNVSPGFDGWMDPQGAPPGGDIVYGSILRCCVLRTLVATSGRPLAEGGGGLVPDLAASQPEISPDGRTWTFRIQPGLRYAPPMEDVEITAPDFVRALERTLRPRPLDPADPEYEPDPIGGYIATFFEVIEGAQRFRDREADTISGIQAIDDHTIEFSLAVPTGDFGERLAFPAMAPIPPGASDGHDAGYGRYLVASGPYMIDGAELLDPSLSPNQQPTLSGLLAGGAITLVRNPSWDPSTDRIRPALVDRIEVVHQPDPEEGGPGSDVATALQAGTIDMVAGLTAGHDTQSLEQTSGVAIAYTDVPAVTFVPLNVARPPVDDAHVRRAINLAIDRAALLSLFGPGHRLVKHYAPDVLTHGLLAGFDPYRTANAAGDLGRARSAMQESRYDHDRDGSCDDPACRGVPAVAILDSEWAAETGRFIRDDLREIGIELALVEVDPSIDTEAFDRYLFDPATRPALLFGMGWGSDYPSAGAWLAEQSRGGSDGNFALVGASDEDLAGWGYPARGVPSVDARVDRCQPLAGSAGVRCWAELEQYLHEEVVPWVPLAQEVRPTVYGQRVVSFASDLVTTDPAYERIAVRAE